MGLRLAHFVANFFLMTFLWSIFVLFIKEASVDDTSQNDVYKSYAVDIFFHIAAFITQNVFFLHSISVVLFVYCVYSVSKLSMKSAKCFVLDITCTFQCQLILFSSQSADFAIFFVHGYYFCLGSHFIGNYRKLRQRKIVCKYSFGV